jgi:hypothetical protein
MQNILNMHFFFFCMFIPKQYGKSRVDSCPFCGKQSTSVNKQGVPVCLQHKNEEFSGLKCFCGESLDLRSGKWGPYFYCFKCGNVSFAKGLEANPNIGKVEGKFKVQQKAKQTYKVEEKKGKEIVIRSDELDFYY